MTKKQTMGIIIAVLFLLAGVLEAKENSMPHGKWWSNQAVIKRLNLTEDEITQLDEVFNESYRKMIDLRSASEKERFELEVLMENEELDEDAVIAQYKKADLTRSAISEQRFLLLLDVRKTIGYERFKTLKNVYEKNKKGKSKKPGKKGNEESVTQ